MSEIVTAIYEQGVLRPTRPLRLHERQRVRIQIVPDEQPDQADLSAAEAELEQIIQHLIAAGLVRLRPPIIPPDPVSAEERQTLADKLGRARQTTVRDHHRGARRMVNAVYLDTSALIKCYNLGTRVF